MAYVTDTDIYIPANWNPDATSYNVPYPGVGVNGIYDDPWTGVPIKRMTEAAGTAGNQMWNIEYPSNDHYNADDTYLLVNNGVTGAAKVISVADGSDVRTLPNGTSLAGYWWDLTDPDLMYFVDVPFQKKIKKIVISTGVVTTVLDLSNYIAWRRRTAQGGDNTPIARLDVGEDPMSPDGKHISVVAAKNAPVEYQVNLSINLETARVDGEFYRNDAYIRNGSVPAFLDAWLYDGIWKVSWIPSSGPSWHEGWSANQTSSGDPGIATHTWDTSALTQSTGLGTGHNTAFRDPVSGNPYLIYQDNYQNHIRRTSLLDGTTVKLFDIGWFSNPFGNPNGFDSYFSSACTELNGWVYYSTFCGQSDQQPGTGPITMWRNYLGEIMRFKWDGSGSIERICHNRSNPFYPNWINTKNYWALPRVSVSPTGNFVCWNSNHRRPYGGAVDVNYADVYQHEIVAGINPIAMSATGSLACAANKTGRGSASLVGRGTVVGAGGSTAATPVQRYSGSSSMSKTGAY